MKNIMILQGSIMKNRYKKETEKIFKAKRQFHKKLAKIPFEEKIGIIVNLQRIANDIRVSAGGQPRKVWKI